MRHDQVVRGVVLPIQIADVEFDFVDVGSDGHGREAITNCSGLRIRSHSPGARSRFWWPSRCFGFPDSPTPKLPDDVAGREFFGGVCDTESRQLLCVLRKAAVVGVGDARNDKPIEEEKDVAHVGVRIAPPARQPLEIGSTWAPLRAMRTGR